MFNLNVAILAYARSDHFHKVLTACEGKVTKVSVYMDYPKNENIMMEQEKMKEIISSSSCHVNLVQRSENYGLVRSVLTSIKDQLKTNDHMVLLEDDCVPLPGFFEFMENSLTEFQDDDTITAVCATRTKCSFNPWGWATWKSKWKYQNPSLDEIRQMDIDSDLLDCLKTHGADQIWSLGWLMTQHKYGCRSHFADRNLINNIGLDDSGVHSHEKGYTSWLLSQIMED